MAFQGSDYKKFPLSRDLADRLNTRLGKLSSPMLVLQSLDTNGNPLLTLQPTGSFSWATGNQYALIDIVPVSNPNLDGFGNTQTVYTPFLAQVVVEGNTAGSGSPEPSTSDFTSVLGWAQTLIIYSELARTGLTVQVYNSGHGTQPVVGSIIAANLEATIYQDLFGLLNAAM